MSEVKSSWRSSIKDGEYRRKDSQFRNWITADGSAGPTGCSGFKAEKGRYHLYVSLACPWAHRTLVFRKLKKLEDYISVSVVHPNMLGEGWRFHHNDETEELYGTTGDTLYGGALLSERYYDSDPDYAGNITVPVLWDKHEKRMVNNESSEIIRMFNTAFNELTGDSQDYYPEALRAEIDEINEQVYHTINNGVYKTGFATSQEAYDKNCQKLFESLNCIDERLSRQRYLVGDKQTEADWRMWTTLIRFDEVYHTHFKCNVKQLKDYEHIYNYMLELYQTPGIAETVHLPHIKQHYYASHLAINPYGIVPVGPNQDWTVPHNRNRQY